jgi:hypothetical protein
MGRTYGATDHHSRANAHPSQRQGPAQARPRSRPSYPGEWTDDLAEWNILRAAGDYVANLPDDYPTPPRGREYRAFRPEAGGERPGSPRYQQYGVEHRQETQFSGL